MADYLKTKKVNLFGGIRAKNLEQINPKFICVCCMILLHRPYQLHCCGTLICEWCFLNGLSDQQPFVCPYCKLKQEKKEASFDRAIEKEMKILSIECFNCKWNGSYNDYLDHLKNKHCDFSCKNCNERFFSRNSYEQHRTELCIHRSLPCGLPSCDTSIKWYDMPVHYLTSKHQCILQNLVSKSFRSKKRKERCRSRIREHQDLLEIYQISHSSYEIVYNNFLKIKIELSELKRILDEYINQINQLKSNKKESEEKLQELNTNMTKMYSTIEQIKQAQKESKISILDSKSSTILSFDIPINSTLAKFQTSTYGYTFMLRLSTTIIENKEYLSLILNLLNGDYYNILPFPFTHDIHIILWDQSNQNKHILHIIKPNCLSQAFIRPVSEKNEDYTIAEFCLFENLNDSNSRYVKDSKFFIGIYVDFLNLGQNPFQVNNREQTDDMAMNTN